MRFLLILALGIAASTRSVSAENSPADFSAVLGIFQKHCLDCHGAQEPDGNLVLESFDALMRGGETGPAIVSGSSAESLLVRFVEGNVEKGGRKKIMPPGKRDKLSATEISTIKAWIDAGARPPAQAIVKELKVPEIPLKAEPGRAIHALSYTERGDLLAVARYAEVDVISRESGSVIRQLKGHRSHVNDVAFSADGSYLFSVSGENGLFGEVKHWNVATGTLLRTWQGHSDTVYSVAVSPDGKLVATGSYDQKIKLWDAATGTEIRTLNGHNGAVFGLAFRPDGEILASASADRTVKLWNTSKGERVDTLSQPTREMHAVVFSRDGKRLYAGGADNRIRVWQISATAQETTNPLLEARFAHEGAVLRLAVSANGEDILSSADDGTVKLWDAATLREKVLLEKQPDWAAGLCFTSNSITVGRLDGSIGAYNTKGNRLPISFSGFKPQPTDLK